VADDSGLADDGGESEAGSEGEVVTDDVLFARLYPALRRLAVVVAPAGTEADDLVQEAVSRALRRGPLVTLDNPGAYLRRAIVNLAANERRRLGRWRRFSKRSVRSSADEGEPAAYPSDVADLLRLPAATRAALWLVDVEGWTFEETAELLGCTREAAKTRASRARGALRRAITEEEQR
jgi:RNA polymerase sigma-70 factor (ECF subfamily)